MTLISFNKHYFPEHIADYPWTYGFSAIAELLVLTWKPLVRLHR